MYNSFEYISKKVPFFSSVPKYHISPACRILFFIPVHFKNSI